MNKRIRKASRLMHEFDMWIGEGNSYFTLEYRQIERRYSYYLKQHEVRAEAFHNKGGFNA